MHIFVGFTNIVDAAGQKLEGLKVLCKAMSLVYIGNEYASSLMFALIPNTIYIHTNTVFTRM